MKERVPFLQIKDMLISAARRKKPVRIRTPWFTFQADRITEDQAEEIFRDMRRAGDEYFERLGYDEKRGGGSPESK